MPLNRETEQQLERYRSAGAGDGIRRRILADFEARGSRRFPVLPGLVAATLCAGLVLTLGGYLLRPEATVSTPAPGLAGLSFASLTLPPRPQVLPIAPGRRVAPALTELNVPRMNQIYIPSQFRPIEEVP